MEFGDNIINRTIKNAGQSLIGVLNSSFDIKMNLNFPLGIVSGYSVPHLVNAGPESYIKIDKPIMLIINKILKTIEDPDVSSSQLPTQLAVLESNGVSIHGVIVGCIATGFFDDQFLCCSLIGLGGAIFNSFHKVGIGLVAIGAAYEYYLITEH